MPTDQKISELPLATSVGPTGEIPFAESGVTRKILRNALSDSLISAALSNIPFFVIEFLGNPAAPQSVDCGNFWDSGCADLGDFFWEFWIKIAPGGGAGHYFISEGYGGTHAILYDGNSGNVWDGAASTSFGADTLPYNNQWAHIAVGLYNGLIVCHYDGVPVGKKTFAGPRRCSSSGGANLFLGGSDHNEFIGRMAQVRAFEGCNPLRPDNLAAFRPATTFGPQWGVGPLNPQANGLWLFDHAQQIIQDKSAGYPHGHPHPGRIRGTGYGFANFYTVDHSNYPGPQFVADAAAPNTFSLTAPVQPAGKTYTPPGAPVGALIYDSFERKNSTFAWEGMGGLGSTESGSLGPKVWNDRLITGISEHSFGILNERAVLLGNEANSRAWVEVSSSMQDIYVDRCTTRTWNMGESTAIVFRYVDDSNYWYCFAQPGGANELCYLYKVVAGVNTNLHFGTTAAFNWTTLRVITKSSDNTVKTYLDATQCGGTITDSALASATKSGLFVVNSSGGSGLEYRWKNYTVKTAV